MACRNSGIPAAAVYFVKPALSALMAASLMCCGVSKSGSPTPKPITSCPSAFICLAFESMASVSEGVSEAARCEILYCINRSTLRSITTQHGRFPVLLRRTGETISSRAGERKRNSGQRPRARSRTPALCRERERQWHLIVRPFLHGILDALIIGHFLGCRRLAEVAQDFG